LEAASAGGMPTESGTARIRDGGAEFTVVRDFKLRATPE
jgi:hypothetical protein